MENGVSALCRSSPPILLGEASTIGGCFVGFVVPGAPEGSTGRMIFFIFFFFFEKPARISIHVDVKNLIRYIFHDIQYRL